MVARYNALAADAPLPMHAVVGDALSAEGEADPALAGPEMRDFDIVAVGLGFHHFAAPGRAAGRLAERCRVGGTVVIVDFVEDGGGVVSGAEHTVKVRGFGEEGIRGVFGEAGLVEVGWRVMEGKVVMCRGEERVERRVFVARGTRGA